MLKPVVFISYSHKNEAEKDELIKHLRVLHKAGILNQWHDDLIDGGDNWESKIRQSMQEATMAIMLISNEFLNSSFISDVEVPYLLERRLKDGIIIFPVIIRNCPFTEIDWLTKLHVRPKNGVPIWKDGFTQEHLDAEFVKITADIKRLLKGQEPNIDKNEARIFKTDILKPICCSMTLKGDLWVADRQQVKVFGIYDSKRNNRWLLPKMDWKYFLPVIWNEMLLCTDWLGGLYGFMSSTKGKEISIRHPNYDDLPVFNMQVLSKDVLSALTWDGQVILYTRTPDENAIGNVRSFKLENLPVKCLPYEDKLIIVDQLDTLFLADASGMLTKIFTHQEKVLDLIVTGGNNKTIILFSKSRIIRISPKGDLLNNLVIKEEIVLLSHRSEDGWTAIVTESNRICWFSWDTFLYIDSEVVETDFRIRKFHCFFDINHADICTGLGLTSDGRFFSLHGKNITVEDNTMYQDIFTSPDNRLVFLSADNQIIMLKNPLLAYKEIIIELLKDSVKGILVLNKHNKISFSLINSGEIPICKLRVKLNETEPLVNEDRILLPGDIITLEFSVKANEVGEAIPLNMEIYTEDEVGTGWTKDEIIYREAKEK